MSIENEKDIKLITILETEREELITPLKTGSEDILSPQTTDDKKETSHRKKLINQFQDIIETLYSFDEGTTSINE